MSSGVMCDELAAFLRAALDSAWPSGDYVPLLWMSNDLHRYSYSDGSWTFIDIWYGRSTDAGVHVVLRSAVAVWCCLYRGGLVDPRDVRETRLDVNPVFSFLAEVLREHSKRHAALPLRGPLRHCRGDMTYEFAGRGTLQSFAAVETITDRSVLRYERMFVGGMVGDRESYGPSLLGLLSW